MWHVSGGHLRLATSWAWMHFSNLHLTSIQFISCEIPFLFIYDAILHHRRLDFALEASKMRLWF